MEKKENKQLTREILIQTTRRRVAVTVVSTILCVVLMNFGIRWYLDNYSPNTGYLLLSAKWNLIGSLPLPVDLLILGDSSGNQSVDPDVIEDKLDQSAVNLCTIGDAMVLNDAWMLEAYIKRHGAPKAAVIVHGYDIWSRQVNISVLSKIPGSWWRQQPELDLSLKQKIRIYLNRYVPIYAETISLTQVLQNPWTAFRRNFQLEPDGFMVEPQADPDRVIKDTRVHLEFVRGRREVMSKPNREALERIVELAEEHRFDVYLVNGPIYEGLAADAAFQAYYETVRQNLEAIAAGSDRLHYLLNPPMTFPRELMQSADLIIAGAAVDYTTRLTEEIVMAKSPDRTE